MNQLGIDVGLLISQAVNFGLLAVLLYFILYKPVLGKLEERAQRIKKGIEDAEQAEKLVQDAKAQYEQEMDRARREAHEVIERATRAAEQQRQEILAQARQEAHDMILRAQQQAQHELQEGQLAVQQRVIDLAISIASRILQEKLEEEKQHEMIQQFLSEASQLE
ncbi:MAG: F0F1 ATP synthase subunit B [Chloroflexi bacterium]|nr:F0F1 ATP synthase subunit B [Chloroflexota bacterium]